MAAARQRAFKGDSAWRPRAFASINANWKKMYPDGDRDERLAWVAEYLGLKTLDSLQSLTDEQLGAVAGEMKRLTGTHASRVPRPAAGNVVEGRFGVADDHGGAGERAAFPATGPGESETVFLTSPEMVYTLEKLIAYVGWGERVVESMLYTRYSVRSLRMLTWKKAWAAVNQFLHIAAHRDLKRSRGDKPVSRREVEKYIPKLKKKLQIDQAEK